MTEFPKYNLTHLDIREINKDLSQNDAIVCLEELLKKLDCTKEYSCGRPMMTHYPMYSRHIAAYLYILEKIDTKDKQFTHCIYMDYLKEKHRDNLQFEKDNPYIEPIKSKTKQKTPKRTYKSKDMFTGEDVILDDKGKRVKPKRKVIIFKDMFKINFNKDVDEII